MNDSSRSGFLSRWSQRKIQARENRQVRDDSQAAEQPGMPADTPSVPVQARSPVDPSGATQVPDIAIGDTSAAPRSGAAASPSGPIRGKTLPSLDDVGLLTPESDFSPFVARGVAPAVKNAALKKLFSDPHFNVMDGLDIYIDDYTQREILPESTMRTMVGSKFLRMFDEADEEQVSAAVQPATNAGRDTDLQPDAPGQDASKAESENYDPVLTSVVSSLEEGRVGPSEVPGAGTHAAAILDVSPGLPTAVTPVQHRSEAPHTAITKSENQPGDAPSDAKPHERST